MCHRVQFHRADLCSDSRDPLWASARRVRRGEDIASWQEDHTQAQKQNADTLTEKVVKATCKRTLSASDLERFFKLVTCSFRSKGGNYSHMDQKNINTKHKARLLACWKDFSCIFLHWYRHSFKIWIFFGSQRICEKPEVHLMSVSCMRTRSPATTGGR